jgi:TP901 family phage tail tape measure protein
MADIESNINLNIDTTEALASIRVLQSQISAFHRTLAKGGASANVQSAQMQQNLINTINKTGAFNASMTKVASTTEAFTQALEQNKLTMGQTFRHSMATTKTFGKFFRSEFDTITKTARERVKDLQTQYVRLGRDGQGAMNAIKVRPLVLDMQNLGTQTAIASQKQQILNQLIKTGSTNLLNWGKNTQWAGRQLMVGFTIPLAMMGAAASKSFMEIEKEIIKIQRVYGDFNTSVSETDEMVASLRTLAGEFTKYGVAVKDTLQLAGEFAAAGNQGVELLAQVREASRLAVLGNVSQQEAFDATISVTNAFGIAAEDLAGKIDFLNAVENQSVTSIEDLTIAIPKAAPVIQQLGGDVEDLAFFLTAMKEGGINASEGANALKSGLASLINPSEKASQFLGDLGINIKKIVEGNAGDVKSTVIEFASALDTLDPLNRARAIEQLFGKFQFSRLSTLFQNVIDQGSQANRVLELTRASSEELAVLSERELRRVESSTTFKFQKAMQDFQTALAPVGEQFLKAITPILEFGTKLLNQFNGMSDGAKNFTVVAVAAIGGLGPILLMIIGLIANAAANIIKFVSFVRGRFQNTAGEVGVLGSQTEYLTQTQLKAMAAAASLQQSHNTLTQQFTSEVGAIQNLIAAYNQAIAAQNRFAAAGAPAAAAKALTITTNSRGGRRVIAPQGYATGVLSVPGPKGAGDVVPAMLSPGEAVIPAKQAQKYSGFISSMISDNVPGFRVGLNPFKSIGSKIRPPGTKDSLLEGMLRLISGNRKGMYNSQQDFYTDPAKNKFVRSNPKIAVKMQDEDLLKLIASKDKRYKSLFETNTSRAKDTPTKRSYVENQLFGLTDDIDPSRRPVYGHMFKQERNLQRNRMSQSLFEKMTGKEKTMFDRKSVNERFDKTIGSLMNPTTFGYGNTSMVLKNRNIKDRTTFTFGDSYAASNKQYPTPARLGTKSSQALNLARSTKDKSFFEAQIMGGFTLKDVKKIVVTQPELIPQLQQALRAQGLNIPVGMPKFSMLQRLKMLVSRGGISPAQLPSMQNDGTYGIPRGYSEGTISVAPLTASEKTPISADDKKIFRDLELDNKSQSLYTKYLNWKAQPGKKYRDASTSLGILKTKDSLSYGKEALAKMAKAGVKTEFALRVISDAAKKVTSQASAQKMLSGIDLAIQESTMPNGRIDSDTFKIAARENFGIQSHKILKEFAHVGPGTKLTAKELLKLSSEGKVNLSPSQLKSLAVASPSDILNMKSGLGFDLENTRKDPVTKKRIRSNAELVGKGAKINGFLVDYERSGIEKWSRSIGFGGGDPAKLLKQAKIFDSKIVEILKGYPADTVVVDSEAQAQRLIRQNKNAVSFERVFDSAVKQTSSATEELQKSFKTASMTPTEIRNPKIKGFKSPGMERKPIGKPLDVLSNQIGQSENVSLPKLLGSKKPGLSPQLAQYFGRFGGRRYANGVVSVPGPKGAGDVVPAMLSPGEAVIPTNMAKKYSPLINAMISGNIPGYKKGRGVLDAPEQVLGQQPRSSSMKESIKVAIEEKSQKSMAKEQAKADVRSARATAKIDRGFNILQNSKAGSFLNKTFQPMMDRIEEKRRIESDKRTGIVRGPRGGAMDADTGSRVSPSQVQQRRQQAKLGQKAGTNQRVAGAGGGKLGGAMMMGGMVASGVAMTGGPIGEAAANLAMPLMSIGMLFSMMPAPIAAVIAVLGGLVAAFFIADNAFKETVNSAIALGEALGASEKSIRSLAEFAGNVTAGEVMDKRRESEFGVFQIQTGKNTFGSTFMESEQGKALLGQTVKSVKDGGTDFARGQITNQMASAVASGALSTAQARSIVANLAKEMGDSAFGIEVSANLTRILGPNGENLAEDPLQVRLEILKQSEKDLQSSMESIRKATEVTGEDIGSGLGGAVLGGLVGGGALAAAGFKIGGMIGTGIAPGIGTAIGAVVGGLAGGATGLIIGNIERNKRIGEAVGANVALQKIALEQQQEMSDSLELDYEQRIAIATAAGDQLKVEELINNRIEDRRILLEQSQKTTKAIQESFASQTDPGVQDAMMTGVNTAIDNKFEGDPLQDVAKLAKSGIEEDYQGGVITRELEYTLKMQLASGAIDPMQWISILEMPAGTRTMIYNIVGQYGGAFANQVSSLASLIEDETVQKNIVFSINSAPTPEEANRLLDFYSKVSQTDGVLDTTLVLEYLIANPDEAAALMNTFEQIEAIEGPITTDVIANVIGAEAMAVINSDLENFNSLGDLDKKIYIQTVLSTISTNVKGKDYEAWLQSEGADYRRAPEEMRRAAFARYNANLVVSNTKDTTTYDPDPDPVDDTPIGGGGGGGSKGRESSTFLDDVVKKIRDVRDQSVKLPKSLDEAMASITSFGQRGSVGFGSLENSIRKAGGSAALLNIALGATEEELEKIYSNGSLTAFGRDLERSLARISLGSFVESQRASTAASKDQVAAFKQLRDAGVSVANAQEMIKDQDLVAGLKAAGITTAETQQAINRWIEAQKEARTILSDSENIIESEGKNLSVLSARIAEFQSGINSIQLQEDDINKKYDERLEALDKVEQANANIAKQQQTQLSLADALSKGDIAAAARAMKQTKEESSQNSLREQRSAIERAREKDLNSIQMKVNGTLLNREEIEKKIADLQKEVSRIDLERIKPAQLEGAIADKQAYEQITAGPGPEPKEPDAPARSYSYPGQVRQGSRGEVVKKLQSALNTGGAGLKVDGIFGPLTAQATRNFQRRNGLLADAIAGPITWRKLWDVEYFAKGGKVGNYQLGGMISKMANGGIFKGVNTDSVPAMLTPGEFVVKRSAVERFGEANLQKINSGLADSSSSVYNYSVNVSVKSDASPDQIAQSVMKQIKQIDSQRIRGNRF